MYFLEDLDNLGLSNLKDMTEFEANEAEKNRRKNNEQKVRNNHELSQKDNEQKVRNNHELSQKDFETICICAIRYCHGRQTYMPSLVRDIIRPHLQEFSNESIAVMLCDCEFQKNAQLYGDELIDKPGWLQWQQELMSEQERRNEGKK